MDVERDFSQDRARNDAWLRLIVAEAAVRRHVLVTGSPPESLESLVPDYLSAVPQDPFSQGPLVYRRTADGYLLYSVGGNGTDDGGERVSRDEATGEIDPVSITIIGPKGDIFFDTFKYEPEAAPEEPEKAPENNDAAPPSPP